MACGSLQSLARLGRTFRGVWRYMIAVDGEKLRVFSRRSRIKGVYALFDLRLSSGNYERRRRLSTGITWSSVVAERVWRR